MDKGLSRTIFGADFTGAKALAGSYRLKVASEIGFKEDWLQSAIAENIELVGARSRLPLHCHLASPFPAVGFCRFSVRRGTFTSNDVPEISFDRSLRTM